MQPFLIEMLFPAVWLAIDHYHESDELKVLESRTKRMMDIEIPGNMFLALCDDSRKGVVCQKRIECSVIGDDTPGPGVRPLP